MSDLFSSGIRPAIDEYLQKLSEEERDYGDYWSASSAGYCMRKNIFQRLKVPVTTEKVEKARKQRVFSSGHLFHEWIQGITKEAGLSIAQELELQDEELMIRGHIDDLVWVQAEVITRYEKGKPDEVKVSPHLILYDYKTRNSRSFNFAKQPSPHHRMQVGTYMYMLRNMDNNVEKSKSGLSFSNNIYVDVGGETLSTEKLTEARVLNIEKDTLRMAEVQYLWDEELEADVKDYWTTLNSYWKERKMPPCTCETWAATEKYNDYFKYGEPCSLKYYKEWKAENEDL
jgi:hypothetical protein